MTIPSPSVPDVFVYYHTHWDREWYWPFRQYQIRLAEVVDTILERLENDGISCFMLDGQTVLLEDYLALRPWNRERLRQLIGGGQKLAVGPGLAVNPRLAVGPWFVMPDELLVSAESLLRNLKRGIEKARHFGAHDFTGYLPDTFGHSAAMPTLLRHMGISTAVIWRGVSGQHSLFNWQAPSGQQVLTLHLTDGYFQNMLHDPALSLTERQLALSRWLQKAQAATADGLPVLLPIGGDHLGLLPDAGQACLQTVFPNRVETTPARFLAQLQTSQAFANQQAMLPVYSGELLDNQAAYVLHGVYSARLYLKQRNHCLTHQLVHRLEPLIAINRLAGKNPPTVWFKSPVYPQYELETAWELLLLNHPHDSIGGCSVDAVHRQNEGRFDQVEQIVEALTDRQMACWQNPESLPYTSVSTSVNTSANLILTLAYTGQEPYTGPIRCIEGASLASNVPSGLLQVDTEETVLQDAYKTDPNQCPLAHLTQTQRHGWIWAEGLQPFSILQTLQPQPAQGAVAWPKGVVPVHQDPHNWRLSNGLLSLSLGPDGLLKITDEQSGLVYPGLHGIAVRSDQGDSYTGAPVLGQSHVTTPQLLDVQMGGGPVCGWFQLTLGFPSLKNQPPVTTRICLLAGLKRIEFETTLCNTLPNSLWQVQFKTPAPIQSVWAEGHWGVIKRTYDPGFDITAHMPAQTGQEVVPNTGVLQRFVAANGQAVITQGLTEYAVSGQTLSITMLRAFGQLSKADTGVRGGQAGPPFKTPEAQCLNRPVTCRYAWLPFQTEPSTEASVLDWPGLYTQTEQFYGITHARLQSVTALCLPNSVHQKSPVHQSFVRQDDQALAWDNPWIRLSAMYWREQLCEEYSGDYQAEQLQKGLVLRVFNLSDRPQAVCFRPGFAYDGLYRCNGLEEIVEMLESLAPLSPPECLLAPHAVETLFFAAS